MPGTDRPRWQDGVAACASTAGAALQVPALLELAACAGSVLTPEGHPLPTGSISHCFFVHFSFFLFLSYSYSGKFERSRFCGARLPVSVAVWSVSKYSFFLFIGCGLDENKKLLNVTVRQYLTF